MTSPSAFLYRYTPGSVGMVRILACKSIARGIFFLILLDGVPPRCVTKRTREPQMPSPAWRREFAYQVRGSRPSLSEYFHRCRRADHSRWASESSRAVPCDEIGGGEKRGCGARRGSSHRSSL